MWSRRSERTYYAADYNFMFDITAKQEARFWSHVDKTNANGCWVWTLGRSKWGYGSVTIASRAGLTTHRVAFALSYSGELLPSFIQVLHACDNPPCCRPDHLFLGTPADNMADRDSKGRNGRLGKKHTEETKLKMSQAAIGNTAFLGRSHSEATKAKLSVARRGKPLSAEHRAKLSTAARNRKK